MDSKGHAKLGDFGTCIHLNESVTKKCKVGSWDHMPPETLRSLSIHFSFDWWLIGICIYQMLLGRLPFKEEKELEYYDNKFEIFTKEREKIKNLLGLFSGLLNKDPIERLQSANTIKNDPFYKSNLNVNSLEQREIE